MQLEEKLRTKKIKLQKIYDDLIALKEKNRRELEINKGELLNQHGVSKSARLDIGLIEARDLRPLDYNGFSDPYAVFVLDDKRLTSTFKPDTLNPVWNEDFSL